MKKTGEVGYASIIANFTAVAERFHFDECIYSFIYLFILSFNRYLWWASLVAQMVKNLTVIQETWV